MKKKEQEPTNKELLNIIIEVADLAVATLNEHREFLQNIKNMPKTQEESRTCQKRRKKWNFEH